MGCLYKKEWKVREGGGGRNNLPPLGGGLATGLARGQRIVVWLFRLIG